jgi:hypothetical protein
MMVFLNPALLSVLSPAVPVSPLQYFHPLPCVNKHTFVTVCDGGRGGLSQIKSCHKVLSQVTFQMTTFCIAFYESYLSMVLTIRCYYMEGALCLRLGQAAR